MLFLNSSLAEILHTAVFWRVYFFYVKKKKCSLGLGTPLSGLDSANILVVAGEF